MMPREPGAYELATKTPIFVPNNQPAMSTYSGKNKKSKSKVYTDTHLNYLLGRDNSSLTMISTETEWKEAVNSNLISFAKLQSKFLNRREKCKYKYRRNVLRLIGYWSLL